MASDSTQPAVSVIVPVYNRRDLIRRTLGALLEQDFDRPYEIDVVDDGSTDGTAEAIMHLDERIRVIRQRNQGAAVARHRGITAAKAPLVAFQDSDDTSTPDRLTRLWQALKKHNNSVLAFGLTKNIHKEHLTSCWLPPSDHSPDRLLVIEDPLPVMIEQGTMISAMNLMTYRSVAEQASRGRSFFRCSNDYDLQLRIARFGSFVCVPRILCNYAPVSTGITYTAGYDRQNGYALCAADNACQENRSDSSLKATMRLRAENSWPRLAVRLSFARQWRLFFRILGIAARHARWWQAWRPLWWELDRLAEELSDDIPLWLRPIVSTGRTLRSRQVTARVAAPKQNI